VSTPPKGKLALPELAAMKQRGDKIVMVTAYDAPGARFAEDAGVEIILVGDTAAMVVLGYEGTTVPVTMDELLPLVRAVARATKRALVVGDMPFGSYEEGPTQALRTAVRFLKEGGCHAVKLEGGQRSAAAVRAITVCPPFFSTAARNRETCESRSSITRMRASCARSRSASTSGSALQASCR